MTKKGVKVIAPDKDGILCYQGDCKVTIDPIFKVLKIHPKSEEFFDICAFFRWKFIQKKNLLFIFGEYNFQDFVVVFKNEELCKRVHDIIYKHKEEEEGHIQEDAFHQRLLIPIFQKLPQNYSTRFKRIMIDWIEQHEENERMELIKLYKNQKRNQNMDIKNVKQEPNARNVRKRRFSETEINNRNNASIENENNESINSNHSNNIKCENEHIHSKKNKAKFPDVIDKSKFKIVNVKHKDRIRRKLLVFTSSEKTKCYEYKFYSTKEFFYHKCKNHENRFKAILALDENGNECIKYENRKHRCSPIEYDPEKYFEIKIVKKPNYEILDNCATRSKKMLIIFDPKNKNQCYEYYWSSFYKKFRCCGCLRKKKFIFAEVFHENTDAEYILLLNDQHVCNVRKYNPTKFNQINEYVLSPNFEIQTKITNGRKTLIIFNENDRKMCYSYYFETRTRVFFCKKCKQHGRDVSAKICQNDDGEDYVILSNIKHACIPQEYIPQKHEVIIRPPKMKFIESNETYTSKLFIFASNDNQLCYIFSKCFEKNTKKYYCLGCRKLTKKMKEICIVVLCKEENSSNGGDEYYVKMMDNQKHICKPQKYQPEKYEIKILKPKDDYILFQKKHKKKDDSVGLAVYVSNDKTLCYEFYYHKIRKYFQCSACNKSDIFVSAKLHSDSDGNERIILNQKKHVCKPTKVSSIIEHDTVILEKSSLSIKDERRKSKEIEESRIIRLPNFELQRNKFGVPEKKLIVFCGGDKYQCYEYGLEGKIFRCKKCKITATLHTDPEKKNEKYIVLGPNEHSCEPVKYVAEKNIIESSQFMIFNRNDKIKSTKLVIFTSATKLFCYEYLFYKRDKFFYCCGCNTLKKKTSAKLWNNNDTNEEYIQLLKDDHVCEPKKFVLEKFQPKIIPENGFKLCSNRNGNENSKLILFDSEQDGFCYEYYLQRNNEFICNQCKIKKKRVIAKLHEKENGEKYIELSAEEHICKSIKYENEIYKENKTIYGNFVLQHNISGASNLRLTIFDENDRNFGYQFYSYRNNFCCLGCKTKNKSTLVKLKTDEEGKQYLECISKTEHFCSIQNFKEKNLVFDDFEFEENGNVLITNVSNKKEKYYKFKYDDEIGGFCCIKCKEEKKKIITATVCNGNDGKEFVLLNYKHYCTALSH